MRCRGGSREPSEEDAHCSFLGERDNGGWDRGERTGGDTEKCLDMRQFQGIAYRIQ